MHKKNALLTILGTALLCQVSGAHALSYRFLADSPERYMKADDYQLLTDTAKDLLDNGKSGATATWENPATRNSGAVKILFSYKDGNLDCRRTGVVSKAANGMTSKSIVNLCSIDGRWKIKEWPAQAFNSADWQLFEKTAQDAMDNVKDGGTKAWKNDKTGNSGVFKLIATADKGDQACRTVNISITTRQFKSAETTLDLCKNPQGVWKRGSAED